MDRHCFQRLVLACGLAWASPASLAQDEMYVTNSNSNAVTVYRAAKPATGPHPEGALHDIQWALFADALFEDPLGMRILVAGGAARDATSHERLL